MRDKFIEKTFLYLVALSVFLHAAIFGLIALIPPPKKVADEPTMVELTDLPDLRPPRPIAKADKAQKSARETILKGREDGGRTKRPARAVQPGRAKPTNIPESPSGVQEQPNLPKAEAPAQNLGHPTLFPGARSMARLEDAYRAKYKPEVEDDETRFLDTDDIRFGSFLRHLENAVYGVWHYPLEARQRGIEGVTPVKITFNRGGEIVQVKLLESSGSTILDDEVLRTLKQVGAIGSLPRGYTGETWNLIAFFQYRMGRGFLR